MRPWQRWPASATGTLLEPPSSKFCSARRKPSGRALLDDDGPRHLRVDEADVGKGACCRELTAGTLAGVEDAAVEPVRERDGVQLRPEIHPGHDVSCRDGYG